MNMSEIFWMNPITACYYMNNPRRSVKKILKEPNYAAADKIIDTVCNYFGMTFIELSGKKRTKEIVYARQICIYLILRQTNLTLVGVGRLIGNRDHTTIIHSNTKIKDLMPFYEDVRSQIIELSILSA